MAAKPSPDEALVAARVGHLNLIQGIITRLAGFSASAKNFCVTIVAAIAGIAFQQQLPILLSGGLFVVVVFALLDVYYLAQERRFRDLYRTVAARPLGEASRLDLDPPSLSFGNYAAGFRSFSTGGFYLLLLIAAAGLLLIGYGWADKAGLEPPRRAAVAAEPERVGSSGVAASASANGVSAQQPNAASTR